MHNTQQQLFCEAIVSQTKASSPTGIQSVQRAAAILRSFTQADSELSVTGLSKQLGWHKSTVSRLLATLEQEGFVERNPETGKYHLGLALVTLAGIVLDRIDLGQVAQPYLIRLAELTQETVNIVVLSGDECMNIGGAASPRPIQYVGRIGRRTPVYCTSAGKVLLAYLPPEQRRSLLPAVLTAFTGKTIIDRQLLEQTLAEVQQQGYALTRDEHQEGLSAVAAPICDHTGQVVAAVTVSGPTYRFSLDELNQTAQAVIETAHQISGQLGCPAADLKLRALSQPEPLPIP